MEGGSVKSRGPGGPPLRQSPAHSLQSSEARHPRPPARPQLGRLCRVVAPTVSTWC